jgi:16S rRNA (adenine1518-N6/adenine1519-N6)-dimethyltransferase
MSQTNFRHKRRLGQHFLHDIRIVDRIVAAADLEPGVSVLEIGPGQGALTRRLLETGARVVAVEVDRRLEPDLTALETEFPNLKVVWGDFMKLGWADLGLVPATTRVVANIPYYITTPILLKLLEADALQAGPMASAPPRPERIILMIQDEVARRLLAREGTSDYGSLTVIGRYAATCESVCPVPRTAFRPRPEVESRVVRLFPRSAPPLEVRDPVRVFRLVRAAFGQRRKTLANALGVLGIPRAQLDEAIAATGIEPLARGETLALEQYVALADRLAERT